MSDQNSPGAGGWGGIFVAVIVGGSAIGVVSWYLFSNRTGLAIDTSGFDLSAAPQSSRAPAAFVPERAQPASSLSFLKSDPGIRIGESSAAFPAKRTENKKDQAHADFKEQARKHEDDVRRFAEKMSKKYPTIRQYGRDWMSRPDLRKLNDDYMRNHDPAAFIMGLTKAPSLGWMVKKYSGSPAIMEFITEGIKEAPGDLTASAMDVLTNDTVAKSLISNVARGLGLPPSITGLINSGGDTSKFDQKKIESDLLNTAAQNPR